MRDISVALAQIAPKLGDLESNLALHLDSIDRAERDRADLVFFPELSLTGYLLRDLVPEVALSRGDPRLARLARASRKIDIIAGFVEEDSDHRFYNSAGYFCGGRLVHVHRKIHLPTYGMFQEGRDFAAGEQLRSFSAPWGRCGMLVCEDLWHLTSAWILAHQGADVIFTLSNGPTRGARPGRKITSVAVWRELLQVTSQFQTAYLVYVNRAGCEDGLTFGGGSAVVDPFGRIVEELPPLDEGLVTVRLEDEVLRRARTAYPLLRDEQLDLVYRELARIRRSRYGLDDESGQEIESSPAEPGGTPRKQALR